MLKALWFVVLLLLFPILCRHPVFEPFEAPSKGKREGKGALKSQYNTVFFPLKDTRGVKRYQKPG